MHIIAIYNNKGGEGKSTVTIGLAEFLAGRHRHEKKVLVMDFDPQASSCTGLLGRRAVAQAIGNRRTLAAALSQIIQTGQAVSDIKPFLTIRKAVSARNLPLGEISILVPGDYEDDEERMRGRSGMKLLDRCLRPALREYDFVLIDMPPNFKRCSHVPMAGLVMSDFVVVPFVLNDISLGGLPRTFRMIELAKTTGRRGRPQVLGMVRNRADRRYQQSKAFEGPLRRAIGSGTLPPVFDNALPVTPAFETATASTIDFRTLRGRFSTYYDHMRRVAIELDRRCEEQAARETRLPDYQGNSILKFLAGFRRRRRRGS